MCHRRCRQEYGSRQCPHRQDRRPRARSAAVVALRHSKLRTSGLEDHSAVLRLLAKRHHDLDADRTGRCRLHTLLCCWSLVAFPANFPAARPPLELRHIRPTDQVGSNVAASRSSSSPRSGRGPRSPRPQGPHHQRGRPVGDDRDPRFGVGPVMAAYLIGYRGDVRRFPAAGHYARYNATAPIGASSGPRARHRVNPPGTASSTTRCTRRDHPDPQRHPRPGVLPPQTRRRQDPQRSDARTQTTHQRRCLPTAPHRHGPLRKGPGGQPGNGSKSSVAGSHP